MTKSNYDKFPFVAVLNAAHECVAGWDPIAAQLQEAIAKTRTKKPVVVVECHPGVDELAVMNELQARLAPQLPIHAAEAYHLPEKIDKLVAPFLGGDDPVSGHVCPLLVTFFDAEPLWRFRRTIDELKEGLVLIVGCGASLIAWGHLLVHADLVRREAQQRIRRSETGNLGANNKSHAANLKFKRAFFVDWRVADRWKRPLIKRWDYALDTNNPHEPKLAHAEDVRRGLEAAARRPFRLVPLFDPAPGGGKEDYARCFDGAPGDDSLVLGFGDLRFELPAIDLVFHQPRALLGETVHARFGDEVPIRFNFADAMANFEPLNSGDGWREERAGLPGREWIETRRHSFTKTVRHDPHGSLNVLKLVQGDEAIVESPDGRFEPFVVHYAETFIVPAAAGHYSIRPHGISVGQELATIKAFVRT